MKKFNNSTLYFLLLLIPVLTLIFSLLLRQSQGPYYLNIQYDPVYPYLISSLNLVSFSPVIHVEHPGTPVQLIGGIVIKLYHLLAGQNPDFAEDVLSRPEEYLFYVNLVLVLIVSIAIFFLGISVYKYTGNIWAAILIQLSPFASYTISYEFAVVNPEHLLISIMLIFTAVLFKYLYSGNSLKTGRHHYVILFSVICGLGTATKITFIPVIMIPFILLKGIRQKSLFLLLTSVFFLIFVSPVIYKYEYFLEWVKRLFVYDGIYGKGDPDIVDPASFVMHLKDIFINEPLFAFSYLFIFITLPVLIVKFKKKSENTKMPDELRCLAAIFFSMTLQLIIVAKHYSGHYMVPALMMVVPGMFLSVTILINDFKRDIKLLSLNNAYAFLTILFCIFISISSWMNVEDSITQRDEALKMEEFISHNYSDAVLISTYGSSSPGYALAFGTIWAGDRKPAYKKVLQKLYPGELFFEFWTNSVYSFSDEAKTGNILKSDRRIIFRNKYPESNEILLNDLSQQYGLGSSGIREVFKNPNGETLYEITVNGSN